MSSVQFNLLPETKMVNVKAARTRRLIVSTAFLVTAASVGIFILMLFTVDVVQKKQMSDANADINNYTKQIKAIPNVNKIVTIQNQLKTLQSLHQNKHITSRLFGYLRDLTPANVKINQFSLDLSANSMQISGTADSQRSINTFIDTLKFTTFSLGGSSPGSNAFSNVLETAFSLSGGNNSNTASFTITTNFDPQLFSNNTGGKTPSLTVPKGTTTRSVLDDPSNTLFNGSLPAPKTQNKSGGQ